jgi:hypothetical protein
MKYLIIAEFPNHHRPKEVVTTFETVSLETVRKKTKELFELNKDNFPGLKLKITLLLYYQYEYKDLYKSNIGRSSQEN